MRIGLANGCFDLFHEGHRFMLLEARGYCDYLIVAVNSDESVKRLKGPDRPMNNYAQRMHNVAPWCSAVIRFEGRVDNLVMELRPDVLFKGYDHSSGDLYLRKPGWKTHHEWDKVQVIKLPELPGYSTTRIYESQRNA